VAVKAFRKLGMSETAQINLKRELELISQVDHPNIVRWEAIYESENVAMLVMEQLQGGELFDQVVEHGTFAEDRAAKAARQILQAVGHLHERRIAHRDIKPENFVYADRDGDVLKLIDFGFAVRRRIGGPKLYQRCGTLQYVAPEVLRDEGYDESADMWSVGAVVYSLLIGKAMYGGSDASIFRKNSEGRVDWSRSFKALSPEAQDFVQGLLCVDPAARLTAAAALQHPWILKHAPACGGARAEPQAAPIGACAPADSAEAGAEVPAHTAEEAEVEEPARAAEAANATEAEVADEEPAHAAREVVDERPARAAEEAAAATEDDRRKGQELQATAEDTPGCQEVEQEDMDFPMCPIGLPTCPTLAGKHAKEFARLAGMVLNMPVADILWSGPELAQELATLCK